MDAVPAPATRSAVGSEVVTAGVVSATRGLADVVALLAAFALSCSLYAWLIRAGWIPGDPPRPLPYITIALVFSGITVLVFTRLGLYRRSASVLNLAELRTAAKGIALAAAYLFAILFFLKLRGYSRIAIVGAISVAVVLIILERRILSAMLGRLQLRGRLGRRVVIYGSGATGRLVMKKIVQAPHIGYHVVGFLDDALPIGSQICCRVAQMGATTFRAPVLGRWDDWRDVAARHRVDDLLVTSPSATPDRLRELFALAGEHHMEVGVVPHLEAIRPDQMRVDDVSAIPVLRPSSASSTRLYLAAKRVMDLAVGSALAVLTAPLWLCAAVMIALESPGPVLFVQERIGMNGRPFRMFKFRTMWRDAPRYAPSPQGDVDPRITRVGRMLRLCGLDELPQLLNVLRGDMSLVGPRPEMPFIVERYTQLERQRLRARPGITGLWQLSVDRHAEIHENIEYDLYYIDHQSLMLDALILLETLFFTLGLVITAPLRRTAEDYRPAQLPTANRDLTGRYVLLALDQRHGGVAPSTWRTLVPATYTLADRWPVRVVASAASVALCDQLLAEPIRRLGTDGYRAEYVSCQHRGELRLLIDGARMVITDLPHIAALAADAGVDHISITRDGVRAAVRTPAAREILSELRAVFPTSSGPDSSPGAVSDGSPLFRFATHDEEVDAAN